MKKCLLSIIVLLQTVFLSLGVGMFFAQKDNFDVYGDSAEAVIDTPPQNLEQLQNARDDQLEHWATVLASFDGRDYGYLTPVRDQINKNTCWAFAAVGAVETNILRSGIDSTATRTNLDLDETVVAYARHVRNGKQDPLLLTTDDTYDWGTWNQGDTGAASAFSIMTQGYALVKENNFHSKVSFSDIESKLAPYKYYVKNYQSISGNKEAIKRAILKYGAVTFNYASPSHDKYYSPSDRSNHTSIIVGWDDNVAREAFSPKKPIDGGAWIIKNSWGSDSGEAGFYYISYEQPIGGLYSVEMAMSEDYQNIYHYDGDVTVSMTKSAGEAQAAIYEAKLSTPTKQEQLKAVMVYLKDDNLDVNVKIYKNLNANPGNVNDKINTPEQGDPVANIDTHVSDSGMHTIDLESAINLEQGEYFSIVVRCTNKYGAPVPVNCAVDSRSINDMTYYLQNGNWVNFKKSNYYADSASDTRSAKIRAITNTVDRQTIFDGDLKYSRVEIPNRLIYYVKGEQITPDVQVYLDGQLLKNGQDYSVKVQTISLPGKTEITILGEGNYHGTRTTYFEVAKAKFPPDRITEPITVYNDIATLRDVYIPADWMWADLDQQLHEGANQVSAVYVGEDREFYQNTVCSVTIDKIAQNPPADIDILSAQIEIDGELVYTGKPIIPNVRVVCQHIELRSGADYTLTFENNINAGVATAIVDGCGRYFGRLSQTFTILKAQKPNVDTTITRNKKATKLSDIQLPEGFVWENEDLQITSDGMIAKAIYVGADAENYEIKEVYFKIVTETDNQKAIWLTISAAIAVLLVEWEAIALLRPKKRWKNK